MMKQVESKKYMLSIHHHYLAMPKSILMPEYGYLASPCDCVNMDLVKLKIITECLRQIFVLKF